MRLFGLKPGTYKVKVDRQACDLCEFHDYVKCPKCKEEFEALGAEFLDTIECDECGADFAVIDIKGVFNTYLILKDAPKCIQENK